MGEAFICRRGGGSIGNKSILYVTIDAGSVVTCTKGNTVKTKIATDGTCKFTGLDIGTWTIKGTKDGIETSTNVTFDKQEVIYITLGYFTATIVMTFPTDCTSVTCTKGDTVLSVPSGSLASGEYAFSVHETGEWVLECTNGTDTDTEMVNVTEETTYTATLSFRQYYFNYGDKCTDITGGWDEMRPSNAKADELWAYRYNYDSGMSSASCSTKKAIDMTEISTVYVNFRGTPSLISYFTIGSATLKPKSGLNSLDVSKVTGAQKISFGGSGSQGTTISGCVIECYGV